MFGAEAARAMARYNLWQNRAVLAWTAAMSDDERRRDRGLYWRSIHGTLNHVLWADMVWMHRLAEGPAPDIALAQSDTVFTAWNGLTEARAKMDRTLLSWTASLHDADLVVDMTWNSAATGAEVKKPRWLLAQHLFNHQTHHRGQLHAAATQAGLRPEATDLFLTPTPR